MPSRPVGYDEFREFLLPLSPTFDTDESLSFTRSPLQSSSTIDTLEHSVNDTHIRMCPERTPALECAQR